MCDMSEKRLMGLERASEGLQPELVREMLGTLDAVRRSSVNQLALTRALRDLRRAFVYLPAKEVWEAAARHYDREVLLDLVAGGEMEEVYEEEQERALARVEGLLYRRELLEKAGGVLGVAEVAQLLGLTRDAVDKRRKRERLVAVDLGRHGWRYPAFQFTGNRLLVGLEEALEALRPEDGWVALSFFLEEAEELGGRTPAEALADGETEAVIEVAGLYGEHVAR
jgi:hypothetical protein